MGIHSEFERLRPHDQELLLLHRDVQTFKEMPEPLPLRKLWNEYRRKLISGADEEAFTVMDLRLTELLRDKGLFGYEASIVSWFAAINITIQREIDREIRRLREGTNDNAISRYQELNKELGERQSTVSSAHKEWFNEALDLHVVERDPAMAWFGAIEAAGPSIGNVLYNSPLGDQSLIQGVNWEVARIRVARMGDPDGIASLDAFCQEKLRIIDSNH